MAEYTMYPMSVARTESPEPRVLYLGDPGKSIPTDFMFWLLKGNGKNILVDTGFTADFCSRFMPDLVQPPEKHPLRQLAKFGVNPEDIDIVIATHAHFDHLSEIVFQYSRARVFLQRREYDFIMNPPHPWFRELVDLKTLETLAEEGAPRFNLLDGDSEITDGISTVMTPGHTYGHQSVLVNTRQGKWCLAGDAAFFYRNLDEDIAPGFNCSLIDALESLERLRMLKNDGVTILPGHDPEIYSRYGEGAIP